MAKAPVPVTPKSKPKKEQVDFKTSVIQFGQAIEKHSKLLFVVLSAGLLIFSVYRVNTIISEPDDMLYRKQAEATGIRTRFDQKTIEQIDKLRGRSQTKDLTLPSGRINPFAE